MASATDPTFYPPARMAMEAEPETLAYVAALDTTGERPDAMGVLDTEVGSST